MGRRAGLIAATFAASALVVAFPQAADAHGGAHTGGGGTYVQENLVSDQPGVAKLTDGNLVNAWGMSHGPNTPLWVSDNGKDVTTLYSGGTAQTPTPSLVRTVAIPGGAPTGQVFNDTNGFQLPDPTDPTKASKALFIFIGEDGDLTAWNLSQGNSAVPEGHTHGAVYKGLALDHSPFGPLLLATNFHDNRVDVFDSSFQRLPVNLLFRDPFIPHGFAPFNVAEVGDQIFVSYAKQDADRHDDVAGPGNGFIDVFTNYGILLKRFASRGVLNSPWGMTIAPSGFGAFSGDLLVGNFGDGRIHAYDPHSGHLLGTLRDASHHPIVIDGLWGLIVGDPTFGGTDAVAFSAGPDEESHGLLGVLRAGR